MAILSRSGVRTALVVLGVLLVLVALAWLGQRRLVHLPAGDPGPPPPGVDEVTLTTEDGLELAAWWLPPQAPRDAGADPIRAVLVLPGNAGDRSLRLPLGRALAAEGAGVLLVDYRGYGGNPGRPTEKGLATDARAAHQHLTEQRGVAEPVVFGESLGAAVATRLATERPVGALVLRSPFTSLAEVAARHYPLPVTTMERFLRDRYPVAELVSAVPAPVTVLYGDRDSIVPPTQSRAVAAAGRARIVIVPGADHNDTALNSGPETVTAVRRALDGA